jgi:hypothetical protein
MLLFQEIIKFNIYMLPFQKAYELTCFSSKRLMSFSSFSTICLAWNRALGTGRTLSKAGRSSRFS